MNILHKICCLFFISCVNSYADDALKEESEYFKSLVEGALGFAVYEVKAQHAKDPLESGISDLVVLYCADIKKDVEKIPLSVRTGSSTGKEIHIFYSPPKITQLSEGLFNIQPYESFCIEDGNQIHLRIGEKRKIYTLAQFIFKIKKYITPATIKCLDEGQSLNFEPEKY